MPHSSSGVDSRNSSEIAGEISLAIELCVRYGMLLFPIPNSAFPILSLLHHPPIDSFSGQILFLSNPLM